MVVCLLSLLCLSFSPSLCVCGLLVAVFFFLGYVCSWSLSSMCLSTCAVCLLCVLVVCWLFMVGCLSCVVPLSVSVSAFFTGLVVLVFRLLVVYVSFMCADYCSSLCVVRMSVLLVGVSWVCVCVFCSSYFRFSFVLLCVSPGFCVWFWVCGGLFLGGCLVGLGFGVVGFWVWGGGFVLWGGCWWCCFLGVVGVGVVLWAILLLLLLLLFFCLECGFGGCWAWCCCW